MAGIYNEDDSTDDEIGINLQLAERLRINREHCKLFEDTKLEDSKELKQLCNMQRKKFAQNSHSSSNSSLEIQNDNPMPGSACSDNYHNKKRQNGDKNIEQLANPKRTCLSDRFRRSPEWRELRKKASNNESQLKQCKFSEPSKVQSICSADLFPDKKGEDHVNSLADAEDSDFELPTKITRNFKKNCGHGSKVHKTRRSPSPEMIPFSEKASTSFYKHFLESDSEDESKSIRQNGALKGGRPEHMLKDSYGSRFFGRKINKKVLDSDESEDDNPITPDQHYRDRCRPTMFSSSDSDKDFRQNTPQNKHTGTTSSEAPSNSFPFGDGFDKNAGHRNSRQYKNYRSNQKPHKKTFSHIPSSRADSSDGCDRQFLSSTFQCKNTAKIPCRTRRSPRMNIATTLISNGFTNGNNLSAPTRGRRISGGDRGSRRSGSPHHRNHHSQHRSDDSKGRGRSVSASRSLIKDKTSYASRFPDVFDAEESDNEFFTANSYSDTETSTESLSAVTINASFPNHRGTISCSIDCEGDGSTDDEIRVVFSTAPYARNNEARRGTSRTLGRRYNRGTTPHRQLQNAQEVVSLSPDPVEQVRQVEEDERMARMLQAQFDAEVDPDYTPIFPQATESQPDSDDEVIDPVGDSDSDGVINYHYPAIFGVMSPPPSSRLRLNRFSNRPGTPNSLNPSIYFRHRRVNSRNRRIHFPSSREATDFQLARLFGLGIPSISTMGDIFNGGDDYEALLSLDLSGEVMPRGLLKSDINRLPTRKYVHPNSASSASASEVAHKRAELNKECQVCLTDYETGDILRILPCFHEFHTPCIDPWLKINHTCPVCRVTVDLDA